MGSPAFQNDFAMRCPKCNGTGGIDVQALVYVRLVPGGTDADASENADREWTPKATHRAIVDSTARCVTSPHSSVEVVSEYGTLTRYLRGSARVPSGPDGVIPGRPPNVRNALAAVISFWTQKKQKYNLTKTWLGNAGSPLTWMLASPHRAIG